MRGKGLAATFTRLLSTGITHPPENRVLTLSEHRADTVAGKEAEGGGDAREGAKVRVEVTTDVKPFPRLGHLAFQFSYSMVKLIALFQCSQLEIFHRFRTHT